MLCRLLQVLTGCTQLGQDSAPRSRDLEQARLKISSKLLALAQNVRGRPGGGG